MTVAVPVVLGSLMRIPLGILTDRHGGRKVFTALMAFTPLPLIGLALFNDSWGAVLIFGFLLGFAGASFAVGVPFVNNWYAPERQGFALGIYGVGMGGTVLGAMTAPKIVDATSLDVPFWIAAVADGRDGRRVLDVRRGRPRLGEPREGLDGSRRWRSSAGPARAARGR